MSEKHTVLIVGLGQTGLSCLRFFHALGWQLRACDTRSSLQQLPLLQKEFPEAQFQLGTIPQSWFLEADRIIISPGVDLNLPAFAFLKTSALTYGGDIDVFCEYQPTPHIPIIAITGSNGKTTVTHMVAEMIRTAGLQGEMIGNVGIPMLETLREMRQTGRRADYFVMECSSFQLELTHHFRPKIACLLNITPDHIDRHGDFEHYQRAKQRIYRGSSYQIYNRADKTTYPNPEDEHLLETKNLISFARDLPPTTRDFGVRIIDEQEMLVQGEEPLIAVSELSKRDDCAIQNSLAALAIGTALGLPKTAMLQSLRHFQSLPHRLAHVRKHRGVSYWNDSKATNAGATLAALENFEAHQVVLIAGGDAKGADLSFLSESLNQKLSSLIILGKDGEAIARLVEANMPVYRVNSLAEAVKQASVIANVGEHVVLSPACASTDMFTSYVHRGELFEQFVREICE